MGVCFVMGRIIDVDFELVCSGGGRGMRVLVVGGVVWGGGMNFVREGILERVLVRKWGRVGDIGGVVGGKRKSPHPSASSCAGGWGHLWWVWGARCNCCNRCCCGCVS